MVINKNIIEIIKNGGVGVVPTDTIYGVVGTVFDSEVVERIKKAKGRDETKRYIVLVGRADQLPDLGIYLSEKQLKAVKKLWENPISVDLHCDNTVDHISGNYGSIAVRMPKPMWLRNFLTTTGPIIATSANVSGMQTPNDIKEIQTMLPGLDFYLEGPTGTIPSRLARLDSDGSIEWLKRS